MNVATTILALLLLLLPDNNTSVVNADCLVEGDMVFIEGQSLGHIGLTCINSTSYNATDSTCGPGEGFDGVIIDAPAVYTCPQDDEAIQPTPYCVQCGPPGMIGSAVCLSTPEVPDYCDVTGGGDNDSGGVSPTTGDEEEGLLPETTPTPTTTATTGDEEEELLPETTPSPTPSSELPLVVDGSIMTMSPTVVCNADEEEGCVDENYRITYCIPVSVGGGIGVTFIFCIVYPPYCFFVQPLIRFIINIASIYRPRKDRVHVPTDSLVVRSTLMVRPHSADIVNQYVVTKDRMAPRSGVVTSMAGHYIGIRHSANR